MIKRYISTTGKRYVFPVKVKGKRVYIEFSGPKNEFETGDVDIQQALEESPKFKNKEISLENETSEKPATPSSPSFEPAVFDEVADINGAIEVLRDEPYKVKASQLKTPEKVKEQAAACNVTFPNWV